jgi:hypothetical protein
LSSRSIFITAFVSGVKGNNGSLCFSPTGLPGTTRAMLLIRKP